MREAVIVANARTPLAKSNRGSFNMTRPDDLASHAIRSALAQVPALDPVEIDDVILGCGLPEGPSGHNVARVALLGAGLPATIPGTTVNRYCSSGLQAIAMAAHRILVDGAEVAVGGGTESITLVQNDKMRFADMVNPVLNERIPGLYMAERDRVRSEHGMRRQRGVFLLHALGRPDECRPDVRRRAGPTRRARILRPRARRRVGGVCIRR